MQVPSMLQGESLKRLLQGAAAGAVATIIVGFYWGGWSLGSTTYKIAKERSELAVIAALAPVCADKFRALPDAEAKQVALSKVESWKRRDEFPGVLPATPAFRKTAKPLTNFRKSDGRGQIARFLHNRKDDGFQTIKTMPRQDVT